MFQGVSTAVLVNWSSIAGLVVAIAMTQIQGSQILSPDIVNILWSDWLILIGQAMCGVLAFTFMTLALKLISPTLVASLMTLELPLAYVVQSLITGELPDTLSCIGGMMVLSGVLIVSLQQRIYEMLHKFMNYVQAKYRSENPNEYTSLL